MLVVKLSYVFWALSSEVGSRHQEQNREDGKAQNGKHMTGWVGLLQFSLHTIKRALSQGGGGEGEMRGLHRNIYLYNLIYYL